MKSWLPSGFASRRNPELLPVVAIVVLLAAVAVQIAMPARVDLPAGADTAPQRAPQPLAPQAANYQAVLARPIFAPDRAPVVLQAQNSGNLSGFEALGTAIGGNVSAALVRGPMGRTMRMKPDDTLQGWRLVSIGRTQLIFDRDGERRALNVDMTRAKAARAKVAQSAKSSDDDSSDDSDNDNSDNSDDDDN